MFTLRKRLVLAFVSLLLITTNACFPASEPTTPVARSGDGALYKIDDMSVAVLKGNWYEMGFQYGTLLKKDMISHLQTISAGMLLMIGKESYGNFCDLAETQLKLYPKRFREIHRGMSDGSGLSMREISILEHYIAADIAFGSGLFCSSLAVWDDFTSDGKLVMGRNFDFPSIYKQGAPYLGVTVFNPTDGSTPTATLGYVGHIGAVNVFNADGVVAEVNVALNLDAENSRLHLNRITAPISLVSLGFDCSGIDQLDAALNTYRFNTALLCTVADEKEARTYEVGTRDVICRDVDEPGMNTVTNWASDPRWENVSENTSEARRGNLQVLARKNKGKIDVKLMKSLFELTISEGGATNSGTIHQFVFMPESCALSIRRPDYKKGKWTDVDLKHFFESVSE